MLLMYLHCTGTYLKRYLWLKLALKAAPHIKQRMKKVRPRLNKEAAFQEGTFRIHAKLL